MKLLHFADAHIDMANYGRHDSETGLPVRVMDFLKSLDTIVDAAIDEKVDLVLFAGDAYKDRSPAPTFQREWGRRIMRLSRAGIPTLLLVGNHDLSPALGRAHALDSFSTLEVPNVRVLDKPQFLRPDDLWGLPLQIIALPWVSRSGMMATLDIQVDTPSDIYTQLEDKLVELVNLWLEKTDPALPTVLTAHASVQGAKFGGERAVLLGNDLVLSGSLVKDSRLDYVALGHIHKPQDLNEGSQPPVIYPGSIERVDFGEIAEDKFYILAHLEKGQETKVEWRQLDHIRPFLDRYIKIESQENVTETILKILPSRKKLKDAIFRLILDYPRDWEPLIDEVALRAHCIDCFEFHFIKRPQMDTRVRLPDDQAIGALTPLELLDLYWKSTHADPAEVEELQKLVKEILAQN
ncbi:MAG TPA: exonuclease SbcCD subunit D [Anaerolineales bacterium]|nr:exonuclease SbcCD subunit D [Anaerolineales bacterium]